MGLGTGNLSALFQHSVATCNNSCWWPYSRLGPLAISAPIPLFLSFLHLQFTVNKCHKSCWWLDSNPGPLVFSKATSVEAINTASSWAVVVVQLVAFKARGPRFESSHRWKFLFTVYCQLYWKDEIKEKGGFGMAHLKTLLQVAQCSNEFRIEFIKYLSIWASIKSQRNLTSIQIDGFVKLASQLLFKWPTSGSKYKEIFKLKNFFFDLLSGLKCTT